MFDRNWLFHPPVGVGLAVIGLLLFAGLYGHYKDAACRDSGSTQHCSYAEYRSGNTPVAPVSKAHTPPADPKPKRDEWRQEQDLKAQQRMALWAVISVFIAGTGVIVTGFGIYYVRQTLEANRAAVGEAARSADASMDAAKAAQASVVVARETAQRELRAYLTMIPGPVKYDWVKGSLVITIIQKNSGATPAKKAVFAMAIVALDHPLPLDFPFPLLKPSPGKNVVPPGADFGVPVEASIPKDHILELRKAKKQRVYFFGSIIYEDIFDIEQQTTACWCYDPALIKTDSGHAGLIEFPIPFEYADRYNDAT